MTSLETVKTSLTENYGNFSGRASRSEYWYFQLYLSLIIAIFLLIAEALSNTSLGLPNATGHLSTTNYFILVFYGIGSLGLFLPSLSLVFRRMHDLNLSGWWFIGIVTVAYFIGISEILISICVSFLMIIAGTVGANKYGDDPVVGITFFEKSLSYYWGKYKYRLIISSCIVFGLFLASVGWA